MRRAITRGADRGKISLRERAAELMQPEKKVGPPPTVWQSLRAIILASYLNVLLVCVPVSWALDFALPNQYTLIFVFSFLAIIPLVKLFDFATEELSLRVGKTLAELIHVTLGNAVGLIFSIIALTKCQMDIVMSSFVGYILSNLLLVLGMCFLAGGLRFSQQGFRLIAVQTNSSLLIISVIAVLLPRAFAFALGGTFSLDAILFDQLILDISHGVAIILLFIYVFYLFFQLVSHGTLYGDDSIDIRESKRYSENPFQPKNFRHNKRPAIPRYADTTLVASLPSSLHPRVHFLEPKFSDPESADAAAPALLEGDAKEPQMNVPVSIGLLIVVSVVVGITGEFLVGSINGLADTGGISRGFIGVILLPIIGNVVDDAIMLMTSVEYDRSALILDVAVGSSIIALFVIPFLVTLGWILGKPLTLFFDPLQSTVLFLSVLTVNCVVQDGSSNWLKGMILTCLYLLLCVTFWYYPGTDPFLTC